PAPGPSNFDDMPVTITAPSSAPARLNSDARTVQGQAPPEVLAAIEARKRAASMNPNRDQAITAPGAAVARLQRPTVSEPVQTLRGKKKKGGAGVVIGVLAGVLVAGASAAVWLFLLGPVAITVSSTPN